MYFIFFDLFLQGQILDSLNGKFIERAVIQVKGNIFFYLSALAPDICGLTNFKQVLSAQHIRGQLRNGFDNSYLFFSNGRQGLDLLLYLKGPFLKLDVQAGFKQLRQDIIADDRIRVFQLPCEGGREFVRGPNLELGLQILCYNDYLLILEQVLEGLNLTVVSIILFVILMEHDLQLPSQRQVGMV